MHEKGRKKLAKPRKRKSANSFEQMMGVHGTTSSFAQDVFTNAAARTGFGTPSLGQGASYELVRLSYDYWQLITLFRNHWISRRIVEVPAQDMVKAWPKLTSDIEPKDITRIDRALRKTNTKNNVLTALTWGRLFGGAGGLIVVDGQDNELDQPLDIESVGIGAYKGIIPFDRWAGISPLGDTCTDINRPLDFNKPEMYECRVNGGQSFQVHSSRLLRFLGPTVPTPELEAQSYWGISVLEPTYESITRLDNMYFNLLNLSFRANLIGMKFPELAQLLSGLGSSQVASAKFEQRMQSLNHLMSNQSLIPLPADGSIEQTQYSFGGMSDVLQLFQLDLAGAAQMPITRLFGRTYSGFGQAGDGDERIYEEKISVDQSTYMLPQLEKLYSVVCMSELGEVPEDLDLICPSIRVLGEQEKSDLAKSVADTTTVYLNGGIMSPRRVAMEVKRSSDITGIGATLDDEYIAKLSDDVQSEGEMGEGLFGGEGAGLNEASSPAKAIKAENKEDEEAQKPDTKELAKKAGEAQDAAPAMDELPEGLGVGERVLVAGRLLTVASIGDAVEDLDGELGVPVVFKTGEVVAYKAPRAWDASSTTGRMWAKHAQMEKAFEAWVLDAHHNFGRDANYIADRVVQALPHLDMRRDEVLRDVKAVLAEQKPKAWDGRHGTRPLRKKAADEDGANSHTQSCEDMLAYHALPVRVENLMGAPRGGITPKGESWHINMPADYGFIEGVLGADGDNLDCYIGASPESGNVYVIDQTVLDGKGFDEHKVMLGYHTRESALEDYMMGHHKSNQIFAAITPFTMPQFRKWMQTHDMSRPCNSEVKA